MGGVKKRECWSDNLRFILMFLVVYAHLAEHSAAFGAEAPVYRAIYSFHMPAFVFLSGYYVSFSPKKLLFRWIIPYFVFQTLYLLFDMFIVESGRSFDYTTPYWHLWYMLACVFWQLLIPVYRLGGGYIRALTLTLSVAAALAAGFFERAGYYLSMSRFLVFQPWFILGFYCRKTRLPGPKPAAGVICGCLACLSVAWVLISDVPVKLLYGSYSYAASGGSAPERAALMATAVVWLGLMLFALRPLLDRPLGLMTYVGRNTLPIFLLHGFVVKLLAEYLPGALDSPIKVLIITCAVLAAFGNSLFSRAMEYVCLKR